MVICCLQNLEGQLSGPIILQQNRLLLMKNSYQTKKGVKVVRITLITTICQEGTPNYLSTVETDVGFAVELDICVDIDCFNFLNSYNSECGFNRSNGHCGHLTFGINFFGFGIGKFAIISKSIVNLLVEDAICKLRIPKLYFLLQKRQINIIFQIQTRSQLENSKS